jgi:hypothetical protein
MASLLDVLCSRPVRDRAVSSGVTDPVFIVVYLIDPLEAGQTTSDEREWTRTRVCQNNLHAPYRQGKKQLTLLSRVISECCVCVGITGRDMQSHC